MDEVSNPYEHIIPDLKEWPITKFSESRDAFIERLIDYVLNKILSSDNAHFEILNKTIYLEQKRVRINPWKVDPGDEKEYWNSLAKELQSTKTSDNPDKAQIKILRRIIHRYSEEIIGHFIPKTHLFARKILTAFFKRLFNNGLGRNQRLFWGKKKDLLDKIKIDGHIDSIRQLFELGTVVIVPTHYTNLDSLMIAYGIDGKAGLPAFAYGAGLNLYDVELLAYYMNRLGAYRVDRRKKNPIYLETLKGMASLSLIEGLNHIFFPGGTRSRSGAIEDKLKLGLLNSVIDAQRHCLTNKVGKKIFIVPLAVGYHFVLEAQSLIEQHLKVVGKERYTKTKNKSTVLKTVWNYFKKLRTKQSEVYLSFGQPMDVLGNKVNMEGISIDKRGKEVDLASYFSNGDEQNYDAQRESIYTRILAERIVHSFKSDNIVLSSHLIAYAAFKLIQEQNEDLDIYDLLNVPVKDVQFTENDMLDKVASYQKSLMAMSENGTAKLSKAVSSETRTCLEDGLSNLGIYHNKRVLKRVGKNHLGTEDLRLLYYYHNKVVHYDLSATSDSQLLVQTKDK